MMMTTTPDEVNYLNDEMTGRTMLSTRLDWCVDHPDEDVFVSVCLYRIVKRKKQNRAFLSFLMEKSGDEYTFPSFVYSPQNEDSDSDSEDPDQSLKLACIEKLVDIRSLQQDLATSGRATLGYKGLVANKNHVFAVFDADELEKTFSKSSGKSKRRCVWAILDEIVRRKSVNGVPVDPQITEMFQKNPLLQKLGKNGEPIAPPRQLYLVVVNPDADENPYRSHIRNQPSAIMELPHRFADRFDKRFLLTEQPLSETPLVETPSEPDRHPEWIRYAAFIEKPVYVFDRETITPQKQSHFADLINKYSHDWDEIEQTDEPSFDYRNVQCISLSDRIGKHPMMDAWGLSRREQFVPIDEE